MENRNKIIILVLAFNVLTFVLQGQQSTFYKSGSLQLPNSDKLNGYIWMPGTVGDSVSFIYFRKNFESLPIRYNATELISFEFENRQFISLMIPFREGNYQRITELHFEGSDYSLLSTVDGKDIIFYLISRTGAVTVLVNTYSLPGIENKFTLTYNYEYRYELKMVFNDHPELLKDIQTVELRAKELVRLLIKYHQMVDLPYTLYTVPNRTIRSVGISGGYSQIKSVSLIDINKPANSPFIDFRLFGELVSEYKPIFINAGVSFISGKIWHDLKEADYNVETYYDITTTVSLVRFDMRLGVKLLKVGNFSPYISVGGEYSSYLNNSTDGIQEDVYSDDITVVYTTLIEDEKRPKGFPGAVMEIGTSYMYNKSSDFRFGISYHYFFDEADIMKNSLGISLTYSRIIF